jgi:hypothetical protein
MRREGARVCVRTYKRANANMRINPYVRTIMDGLRAESCWKGRLTYVRKYAGLVHIPGPVAIDGLPASESFCNCKAVLHCGGPILGCLVDLAGGNLAGRMLFLPNFEGMQI